MNHGVLGYPGRVENVQGIAGEVRNLVLKANTGTPITKLDVALDDCLVATQDGRVRSIGAQAVTVNYAVNGMNGLDVGAVAGSTWYYVWLIWNEFAAAGLVSLSSSAPLMPAGFTHKGLIGESHYDGASALRGFILYAGGFKRFEFTGTGGIAALNTVTTFPHRLGKVPGWMQVRLVCAGAEFGYVLGDELNLDAVFASASSSPFANVYMDASNVNLVAAGALTAANTPQVADRTTPGTIRNLTAGNWNWKVIAGL